ncbi:hypothetical protein CHS0354_009833 [Potamilus streckersoni]|uniref:Myb/SANT-like DNA-binding domain-containing protein n=1 Tax=Potamilus streckersoni TaxID=2493646 RepID=A0AAE0W3W8_9BIVA|nr:hypothetical protein CHS0354_009833 [Potamilus streckersoni]
MSCDADIELSNNATAVQEVAASLPKLRHLDVTGIRLSTHTYEAILNFSLKSFQCTMVDSRDVQYALHIVEQFKVTVKIIYVFFPTEKSPKVWISGETDLLFALCLEKNELFKMCKIHAHIWNSISAEMEKQEYTVSGGQYSNKWKSLKRSYMETVDHNSKTGEYSKPCKYFGEINQLFGNKPCTQPTFTLHSSGQSSSSDASTTNLSVCKYKDEEDINRSVSL